MLNALITPWKLCLSHGDIITPLARRVRHGQVNLYRVHLPFIQPCIDTPMYEPRPSVLRVHMSWWASSDVYLQLLYSILFGEAYVTKR